MTRASKKNKVRAEVNKQRDRLTKVSDADRLLDMIELAAKNVIKRYEPEAAAVRESLKAATQEAMQNPDERPKFNYTRPAIVSHATAALSHVAQARAGDMAAAMNAMHDHWMMCWESMGAADALARDGEALAVWRGHKLKVQLQERRILDVIGDAEDIDTQAFIRDVWEKEPKPKTVSKALSQLSAKLKEQGAPYTITQPRLSGRVVVIRT